MSFTLAFILFLVVVFVYLVFIEIFTIIFMITGINESKARFQVISLVTNTGFTTEDSELIMNSNLRKRIAKFIMIFSYCFSVSVIALLVNFFMGVENAKDIDLLLVLSTFIVFCFIYVLIKKVKWTKRIFYTVIEKLTKKLIYKDNLNNIVIIEKLEGERVLAKIIINIIPKDMENKTMEQSGIKKNFNIQIISINRDKKSIFPVKAHDEILKDDCLFIVGNISDINRFANNI